MAELLKRLDAAELAHEIEESRGDFWTPLPGPQTVAYESDADVVGYGGAAGGGKTDLAIGKALTKHTNIAIFRRNSTELHAIVERLAQVVGNRDGLNQVNGIWRLGEKVIELCSVPYSGDETKYQGRAHDLLIFDEAANLLESQVRFLSGWVRTTDPEQHCQILMCFNPPTSPEGRWVIPFFAPWLDKKHPNPAKSGEIRWFAAIDGKDIEVPTGDPFEHGGETITPQSRTFIFARVQDNPHLMGTGYLTQLQALPEPLRSKMLHGDFAAGMEDANDQLIPTQWVEEAQNRWKKKDVLPTMTKMGVDVARGGRDSTVIARRHGNYFDELVMIPGTQSPDGPTVAANVISRRRDECDIYLDVIGVGASPYDFLKQNGIGVIGVNVSESGEGTDKSGKLQFFNLRSKLYWKLRELLDPMNNTGVALPPDQELLAELTSLRFSIASAKIKVEGREEVVKRVGRSPDKASAVMLTLDDRMSMGHLNEQLAIMRKKNTTSYNPYASF